MNKERLYDAFGELIYALAMVDGLIQPSEIEALAKILKGHPWASQIKWSFNYEVKKGIDINDIYEKALGRSGNSVLITKAGILLAIFLSYFPTNFERN